MGDLRDLVCSCPRIRTQSPRAFLALINLIHTLSNLGYAVSIIPRSEHHAFCTLRVHEDSGQAKLMKKIVCRIGLVYVSIFMLMFQLGSIDEEVQETKEGKRSN